MIVEFKPVDLTTFIGSYNGKVVRISKLLTGNWKIFVNNTPARNGEHPSSRTCMDVVERAVHNILKREMERNK